MSDKPRSLNGCMACRMPAQPKPSEQMTRAGWQAYMRARDRHIKKGRIMEFANGRDYLELCDDHWAEVRRFVSHKTLEAFA